MSYAPVGAFGAFGVADCPCPACAAPKTARCDGGEMASNCPGDVCCPTSTFTNHTYKLTKGSTSLLYWNEKRVRHALNYLLSVAPQAESTPAEELAYDLSAPDPTALLARMKRAAATYHLLFPSDRWYKDETCRKTDCQSDGYYSCYRYKMPGGIPQRLSEILKLSGSKLTAKEYEGTAYGWVPYAGKPKTGSSTWDKGAERWPELPAGYKAWASNALGVIATIPGGEPNANHRVRTNYGEWARAVDRSPGLFLAIGGGQIVPAGWLKSFLDVFAPVKRVSLRAAAQIASSLKRVTTLRPPGPPPQIQAKSLKVIPTDDDGNGNGVSPLLIIGGVALVGGAAFLLMRQAAT